MPDIPLKLLSADAADFIESPNKEAMRASLDVAALDTDQRLIEAFYGSLRLMNITHDANDVIETAVAVWSDGVVGQWVTISKSTDPLAVTGFSVTYPGPRPRLVTQPAMTRDPAHNGAVTNVPAPIISVL